MKIGVSRISTTPEQATEVVREAKAQGFDGVQIKTNQLQTWNFDPDAYHQACGDAAAMSRGGIVFHPGADFPTWAEKTSRVLAFAKAVGSEHVCYCFNAPPDQPDSLKAAVAALHETGRIYRDAGIPFSLHNHTGSLFAGLDELLNAFEHIDTSLCGLTFDTAHAYNCGIRDLADAIGKLAPNITNVHFKDSMADGTFCPIGTGVMDLAAALDALRAINFAHWLIVDEESKTFTTPDAYRISIDFLKANGVERA